MAKKTHIIVALVTVAALVTFYSVASAETKKCSGTAFRIASSPQGKVVIGDIAKHEMALYSYTEILTSDCAEYDGAVHMGFGYSDYVGGSGPHQGYYTHINKDGDKEFGRYSGTSKMKVNEDKSWEVSIKGTFEITGGTGIFAGRKGRGTYEGKATAEGMTYKWEAEIEVQ